MASFYFCASRAMNFPNYEHLKLNLNSDLELDLYLDLSFATEIDFCRKTLIPDDK